jgi:hypothetical protein
MRGRGRADGDHAPRRTLRDLAPPDRERTTLRQMSRRFVQLVKDLYKNQGLIWFLGLAVIGAGVICLYLSYAVMHQAWSQGTFDAFGVGFVVGGLVDVLAIPGMTRVLMARDQKRQKNNKRARQILRPLKSGRGAAPDASARRAWEAVSLLRDSGGLIDPKLQISLMKLVQAEPLTFWSTWPVAEGGPDHGDAPTAPGEAAEPPAAS